MLNRLNQRRKHLLTRSNNNAQPCSFTIQRFVALLSILSVTACIPSVANAVAKAASTAKLPATVDHLHTGQKVANFFRTTGLPDITILAIISALPVVELRGAVPVGVWMGLPIETVLPICVLGNMAPIIPILLLLRNKGLRTMLQPILDRAQKKTSELGMGSTKKQWVSLAAFVGIPLPGTGAWTGAMGAFLLGMPFFVAFTSIFAGVITAGMIMSAITLAGRTGGIVGISALLVLAAFELFKGGSDSKASVSDAATPIAATSPSLRVASTTPPHATSLQNFLEAKPYYDQSSVPVNVFKNKAPFTGKVVSTKRIVGPQATGETCHIIIDHNGDFPYWEGQSWGVIPPGVREKDGKPHSVRLYSIASTRYGDDFTGRTGSLCVRRATYWCPTLKADDPAKKGICSNFLCDTKPGDAVQMTGPAGKVMLLPEQDPKTDYIMVATGTGIAPYRGFLRRLFVENTPAASAYEGQAWLFLGVANSDALLYDDEWQDIKNLNPKQFRLDYALSREQNNQKGGKMYIQDKVEEYADEVFTKLENGAHIYFCGLKGMMPGIQDMLKSVAEQKGLEYEAWLKGLKEKKQWHVEVY
jgi:ferredoxin--NADP+ reductase